MKYQSVFFDLDGTLIDTSEGIVKGLVITLERFGIKEDEKTLFSYIGPPLEDSFRKYFQNDADTMNAVEIYREYYMDEGIYLLRPFEGILEAVNSIKQRGMNVYVATSKPQDAAESILNRFGFRFDGIYGALYDKGITDKKQVLSYALKKSGEKTDTAIMIGDTKYDLEGALYVGMDCAIVSYGYGFDAIEPKPSMVFSDTAAIAKFFAK